MSNGEDGQGGRRVRVFLSYSSADRARVAPFVAALERRGFDVFWDPEIPVGTPTYNTYLAEQLDRADRVVVVWTAHSASSSWVIEEANEARSRGVLVPVQLEDCAIPLGFRSVQTLDLRGWSGSADDAAIGRLADSLRGRPTETAAVAAGSGSRRGMGVIAGLLFLAVLAAFAWRVAHRDGDGTRNGDGGGVPPGVTQVDAAPPAPELAPMPDGYQRFGEQRQLVQLAAGEEKAIGGFDLWSAPAGTEPSCATGLIAFSWQVREPYPGGDQFEVRTEIPRNDQTELLGSGASGTATIGWCSSIILRNLNLEPIRVELRFASELGTR